MSLSVSVSRSIDSDRANEAAQIFFNVDASAKSASRSGALHSSQTGRRRRKHIFPKSNAKPNAPLTKLTCTVVLETLRLMRQFHCYNSHIILSSLPVQNRVLSARRSNHQPPARSCVSVCKQ